MRVLAMPVASMLFAFSIQFLVVDGLRLAGVPAPVRISSLPVGAPMRPSVYSIVEDIVAVDGCGGTAFRERLNRRYEASRPFRTMLHRLTLFWASGALATATVTTVLVWTIKRERAYVVRSRDPPLTPSMFVSGLLTVLVGARWAGPCPSCGPVCGLS